MNRRVEEGQVRILIVKTLDIIAGEVSVCGDGDGSCRRSASRNARRIAAVPKILQRVEVVRIRIVDVRGIEVSIGEIRIW